MVEEVKKGNRTTSTFSKKAWKSINDEFTKQTGLDYTLHQLKNKMNKLRQEYSSFKKLLSIYGFGWNTVWKTATTEDASLWDVHIKDNCQWEKFQKNGLPYWEQLVEIFGDVYVSGDNGVGNAEVHQISDGDGDNIDSPVETTSPVLHRQEYKEDEHMLNEDLFASDLVEALNPVLHRQDKTPNEKRRRRSGNKDIAMACQAIQDLVRLDKTNATIILLILLLQK
ncbi:hypothetical protein K1719_025581 [Acacia pycnantha]|nr:hypothetical protein K1719_025581 [Acacia pycnantha]